MRCQQRAAVAAVSALSIASVANADLMTKVDEESHLRPGNQIYSGRLRDLRSLLVDIEPLMDGLKHEKVFEGKQAAGIPIIANDSTEESNEFNEGVPDGLPDVASQTAEFDDEIWNAAMDPTTDEVTDDVPTFEWPDTYTFFTTIDVHNEAGGTSIINSGTIDLDYYVEVDEDKSLIHPYVWNREEHEDSIDDLFENPFFFFSLNGCDSVSEDDSDYFSYMIASYMFGSDEEKAPICFKPPDGTLLQSSGPATISKVIQLIHHVNDEAQWNYVGTSDVWFYNNQIPVKFFVGDDPINPIVLALNATDDKPFYLQVRYKGLFVRMRFWGFDAETAAFLPIFIENVLTDDVCNAIPPDGDYYEDGKYLESSFFEQCAGDLGPEDLRLAIVNDLGKTVTGKKRPGTGRKRPGTRKRMLQDDEYVSPYPSAQKPYKMVGDNADKDRLANDVLWFVPSMNDRPYLPVRNQGNCGSCWVVAATHSISSAHAQQNKGEIRLFSYQHVINCMSIDATWPIVAGCFAGWVENVFDWLVFNDRMLPLLSDIPYIEFQAGCYRDYEMALDTGVKGYSQLKREARIKDALYHRGDVVVSLKSTPLFEWVPSWDDVIWSNDGSGNPHLGDGISGSASDDEIDHTVVIIGWGPCRVVHCGTNEPIDDAQCWIVQNTWGKSNGYHGYYFVHTDRMCDLGISKFPYIPIVDDRLL